MVSFVSAVCAVADFARKASSNVVLETAWRNLLNVFGPINRVSAKVHEFVEKKFDSPLPPLCSMLNVRFFHGALTSEESEPRLLYDPRRACAAIADVRVLTALLARSLLAAFYFVFARATQATWPSRTLQGLAYV